MSGKEYIDREALVKKIFPMGMVDDGRYAVPAKSVKVAIDSIPAADVVAVVRCKDCKYCEEEILHGRKTGWHICKCSQWQDAEGWLKYVVLEDFCSYGARTE